MCGYLANAASTLHSWQRQKEEPFFVSSIRTCRHVSQSPRAAPFFVSFDVSRNVVVPEFAWACVLAYGNPKGHERGVDATGVHDYSA
jgi:hypothetical protein